MKYSLRSMMIVVTLVCVALGGRTGYLRGMKEYHQQAMRRSINLDDVAYHDRWAFEYRWALKHPWSFKGPYE